MHQRIRFMVAAILLLGILFLARNQVARANESPDRASAEQHEPGSVLAVPSDEDCDLPKNKNKEKCKDKGTVKRPPEKVLIPVTGQYSVGGFCTLTIEFSAPEVRLEAVITSPLPRALPDDVQAVSQGCLLTYYSSAQFIDVLPEASGSTTICFAVTPTKEMLLYFYDIYADAPEWVAIPTTVQDGIACASGNASGVYTATYKKP